MLSFFRKTFFFGIILLLVECSFFGKAIFPHIFLQIEQILLFRTEYFFVGFKFQTFRLFPTDMFGNIIVFATLLNVIFFNVLECFNLTLSENQVKDSSDRRLLFTQGNPDTLLSTGIGDHTGGLLVLRLL